MAFPLRVCKAITGHKSQGMTIAKGEPFEMVVVKLPEKGENRISMKSAAPLVDTPKADWLARNFVWWSRWEGGAKGWLAHVFCGGGGGKGLAGACFLWFG